MQHHSDDLLQKLKMVKSRFVPLLFYMYLGGDVKMVIAKIVDGIILTSADETTKKFLSNFNSIFELGSVVSGPVNLRLYGINIIQSDEYRIEVNADNKSINVHEHS